MLGFAPGNFSTFFSSTDLHNWRGYTLAKTFELIAGRRHQLRSTRRFQPQGRPRDDELECVALLKVANACTDRQPMRSDVGVGVRDQLE